MRKKRSGSERNYKDPLREYHPATSVILAGYRSRLSEYSVKPPLFRTSTFEFPNAAEGGKFFQRAYHLAGDDGLEPGLVYSRLNNPNTEIIEDKLVAAEASAGSALIMPSGMSAITTSIMALVPKGGKILYTDPVYGGCYLFFKEFCPQRFGITTHSVDTSDLGAFRKAMRDHGPFDMIYLETPANPTMMMTDIAAIVDLTRKASKSRKNIIAVDNTFLGPVFQSPFVLGADVVFYSATKFLGGHSDLIAGVVLTRNKALVNPIRDYRTILGATIAPDTAWMLTRSIETVWVRMMRQAEKAAKVAEALCKHPKIEKVVYPGLLTAADGEQYRTYKKQCTGAGSMMSIYLRNADRKMAYRFLDSVRICHLAVSLGGTESLVEHPRSMTHSDMSVADLDRCGITEGLIRLSIGLESSDDLITDLRAALAKV